MVIRLQFNFIITGCIMLLWQPPSNILTHLFFVVFCLENKYDDDGIVFSFALCGFISFFKISLTLVGFVVDSMLAQNNGI